MKLVSICTLAIAATFLFGVDAPALTDYVQKSCDVSKDSAAIWVDKPSYSGDLRYNVQFDPQGLTVRMPPEFYAPDWNQVEKIVMRYPNANSNSGTLQMLIHNGGESERRHTYVQPVGIVRRSCWNAVKKFIENNVPDVKKGQIAESTNNLR